MDYKAILNLMKEMNHTDLTKLEIEEEGVRICIEKAANTITIAQPSAPQITMSPSMQGMPANPMNAYPMPFIQAQPAIMSGHSGMDAAQPSNAVDDATGKQTEEANGMKIVSPMVGTFYVSPSPDKPAFVKVGDKVKKGQTVCIIEAMKLLNEIESDHDGEIVKILVNNEEMVEFGQPLFLIK